MSTDGVEVLERLVEAMRVGDLQVATSLIHPDVVVIEPDSLPYGGTHRGRDAFFQDVLGGIVTRAELDVGESTIRDAGDVVLAHMVVTFTHRETGRAVVVPIVELYTVVNGLITQIDVYPKDTVAYGRVMSGEPPT